ncbi:CoA transferase [Candidatus Amarobacter glycogenicus]|uniref:CoA transferase n=1 Tax=Candidatus Amarobacter glycogenicus TaxID=3140699 RepID=UPI0031CC56BD
MTFNELNHGKRSLALDVATAEGRELFLALAAKSDVVVQNFSPRVMGNLGIDFETLRELNPRIVLASMPAFGLSGPLRDRISYGPGIDAMSGLSHLTGYADGPPMKPGNFFCDQQAGVLTAFAVCAALRHVERTGEGPGTRDDRRRIPGARRCLHRLRDERARTPAHGQRPPRPWSHTGCSAAGARMHG